MCLASLQEEVFLEPNIKQVRARALRNQKWITEVQLHLNLRLREVRQLKVEVALVCLKGLLLELDAENLRQYPLALDDQLIRLIVALRVVEDQLPIGVHVDFWRLERDENPAGLADIFKTGPDLRLIISTDLFLIALTQAFILLRLLNRDDLVAPE